MNSEPTEFHVSVQGSDSNPGTDQFPLLTIQRAADLAQPGDTITVHAGTYRERINPPRGGLSDDQRIVYQAAPGEEVIIKGSEIVKTWEHVEQDVWKVRLPNSFFGRFNPYADLIQGDWYKTERPNHTGAIYLNGEWLLEAATLDEITTPAGEEKKPLWFGLVDDAYTTLWARFPGSDPNVQFVEINVRQTVFYPAKTGINFLTVRGFHLCHAATPWAPPTAEQIGLIGTNWSKGWIIESNEVSYSTCAGIALGKYGDEFDNKSATADAYNQTIQRALQNGWEKDVVGSHIVRNNLIHHCEQVGIVGSLGAIFSTVENNEIHDIHVRQLFEGAEMAGIKFHAPIDCVIAHNHIHHTCRGIWLDWMTQGTRITGNLLHDNGAEDLFLEVNHGPFLVDNNIFISPGSITTWSTGGAFVHNLLCGVVKTEKLEPRETPFMKEHSTEVVALHTNPRGDARWLNNLVMDKVDLSSYDDSLLPVQMNGNVFFKGTIPSIHEAKPLCFSDAGSRIQILQKENEGWILEMELARDWNRFCETTWATTETLGMTAISKLPFTHADGSPLTINTNFFGESRPNSQPVPGPFSQPADQTFEFKVWGGSKIPKSALQREMPPSFTVLT